MRLRDLARKNLGLYAHLLLAARGVTPSERAVAGALLEAERDVLIYKFLTKKK